MSSRRASQRPSSQPGSSGVSSRRRNPPVVAEEDSPDSGPDASEDSPEESTQKTNDGSNALSQQQQTWLSNTVTYLLTANQRKYSIKKRDIVKAVMKDHPSQFNFIFSRAKIQLQNVFGIEVRDLPSKNTEYVLINKLDVDPENPHTSWSERENQEIGLLMIVLSMIFMNGNTLLESDLWKALAKLDIEPQGSHLVFGDVKKLITKEFVRQLYLEYKPIPHSDPVSHELFWGFRAKCEVSKGKLLEFVSKIYDNQPQDWTAQFEELTNGPADNPVQGVQT